jgi:pimeloyl-ACP methyl ester carboxylesterase
LTVEFLEAPSIPPWLQAAYPFHRRMAFIEGTRVHFVDEGEGRPVLLMHGNPTWSYLWRKVIPRLAAAGLRAVVPDLVGLGLSEKPPSVKAHTLEFHIRTILTLVRALDLKELTVVGQDWGGPIAAGVAARDRDRVRAVVFANTSVLPPGKTFRTSWFHRLARTPLLSDLLFRGFNFPIPVLAKVQGDPGSIGPAERRAYAYPLSNWADRAAPLALARMVPHRPGHPSVRILKETERWARSFKGPSALVWGTRDPILGRLVDKMAGAFPGARIVKTEAGHFLQEEVPDELAAAIIGVTAEAWDSGWGST